MKTLWIYRTYFESIELSNEEAGQFQEQNGYLKGADLDRAREIYKNNTNAGRWTEPEELPEELEAQIHDSE